MPLKIGLGLFTGQIPPGSERTFHREYSELIDLVRLAEAQGFDSVWVSEHHGAADGYLPSLTVMLAALAAVTERVELGMGVSLAPFQHPLRFAEDCAVVDQISGGRLIVGLAPGWRHDEFRSFGVPIQERVQRTVELVRICRLAWSERRFSFAGRIHSYDRVAVTPKPAHPLPILMGGFVEAAAARAGRLAEGFLASRNSLPRFGQLLDAFDAGARSAGRDPAALEIGFLHNAFVTEDGAIPDNVIGGIWHQLGTYLAWDSTDTPEAEFKLPPLDRTVVEARTALGDPAAITAELGRWVEACAGRRLHMVVRFHYPGMTYAQAAPALELFARSVMPRLRGLADSVD
jgi:alkanesulfonate monooxygenase SsuD/methylene tetrahydromethanopterin reductase-like flavin-dependent oxidoreductase (luciferase family)